MAYFPFFTDLEGQQGLIVGGGKVAFHKARILMEYGPRLVVTAPEVVAGLAMLEGQIEIRRREFGPEDLTGCAFVVAAAGDPLVNRQVSALCRERRIPVNVVDMKEECSFIFPALVRQGDITVGISTSGSSPAAAQYLKQAVQSVIPDCFEELVEQLGRYRSYVKERVDSVEIRSAVLKELAAEGIANGGHLDDSLVDRIIHKQGGGDRN